METKFTQGEWEIRLSDTLKENGKPLFYDITVGGRGFLSTHKNKFIDGLDDEQQLANAKLIVAAPEMFEMLKDILKMQITDYAKLEIEQLLTKITQ